MILFELFEESATKAPSKNSFVSDSFCPFISLDPNT